MSKVRASYFCSICDYDLQQYIDTENKVFLMSLDTCNDIARNTVPQQSFLITNIQQPLDQLIEILNIVNTSVSIIDKKSNYRL